MTNDFDYITCPKCEHNRNAATLKKCEICGHSLGQGQVSFDIGSAQLTSDGQKTLNKLRQEIEEFNTQTVAARIIGHTSQTGTVALNQTLSQQRAQVAVDYLRSLGLKHEIIAQGEGFSEPLAGKSPADSQNQRTEIRLVRIN